MPTPEIYIQLDQLIAAWENEVVEFKRKKVGDTQNNNQKIQLLMLSVLEFSTLNSGMGSQYGCMANKNM